jgi:uroporphyrinogen decarboxylase
LIGFAGAPWTIFSYMTEGQGSKTFSVARKMLYTQPEVSHQLLEHITDTTISYLQAQIDAGADMVQLFDSWAGILPLNQYREFGLPYIERICNAINDVPLTVFSKGAYGALPELGKLNCNTVGLDWNMDPKECRTLIGPEKTLQGNLDPCLLYADDKTIESETVNMLRSFGSRRHIANLGHGVYPDVNPDKVRRFIDTVKEFNPLQP